MKRPDYRTLQALDAVIRERGFERAAQKLCITQSAVSQRIKQLENMFGQPLLDYRTLQALDAVIRERGFERAAQKLCITQSAVSQRIKQLENMFGQPLLVRTVPPRPTEQGQKLLALLRQVELLEEEWLGDEQTGSTPLLLSLAVNADSLATWLLPRHWLLCWLIRPSASTCR